jgi:hypothetical protein
MSRIVQSVKNLWIACSSNKKADVWVKIFEFINKYFKKLIDGCILKNDKIKSK